MFNSYIYILLADPAKFVPLTAFLLLQPSTGVKKYKMLLKHRVLRKEGKKLGRNAFLIAHH